MVDIPALAPTPNLLSGLSGLKFPSNSVVPRSHKHRHSQMISISSESLAQ